MSKTSDINPPPEHHREAGTKDVSCSDGAAPSFTSPRANRRYSILLLCNFNKVDAQTIIDHCKAFGKYSRHRFYFVDPVGREVPSWLRLDDFDILVIHYSIYTISDWYLHKTWVDAISSSSCYRIMFIQDEYRRVNEFTAMMRKLNIHALFTCVPDSEIPKVYPEEKLPGVKKIQTLTGFVPDELLKSKPDFDSPRSMDVVYRGRKLGYWYGELGQEKRRIAEGFLEHARSTNLKCDISYFEEDRIYGEAWVRFMTSAYCTLGTESGASVFDFTGDIENNVTQYLRRHPAASFEEVRDLFFRDQENRIRLNQISPRMFEAIAYGTCLVLFEGEYSGILKPWRHFIPLKKDFSNFQEVAQKIKDREFTRTIAQTAYNEIVASGKHSYRNFIKWFDTQLDLIGVPEFLEKLRLARGQSSKSIFRRLRNWALTPVILVAALIWLTVKATRLILITTYRITRRGLGILKRYVLSKVQRSPTQVDTGVEETARYLQKWDWRNKSLWNLEVPDARLENDDAILRLTTDGNGINYQISSKITGLRPGKTYNVEASVTFVNHGSIRVGTLSKDRSRFLTLRYLSGSPGHTKTSQAMFLNEENEIHVLFANDESPPVQVNIVGIRILPMGLRDNLSARIRQVGSPYVGDTDHPFFYRSLGKLFFFTKKRVLWRIFE